MADDDSYDILPHRQLAEVKKQIEELKSKQERASPKEIIDSMDALAKTIDSLLKLFQQASQDLKYQLKEEDLASGKESVNEKLDRIIEQNKIIANGMVAISDTVKEFMNKQKKQAQPNIFQPKPNFQQPMPTLSRSMQQQPQNSNMNPMYSSLPPMPQQMGAPNLPNFNQDLPDIPLPSFEEEPKKKGFLGMFRK